MYYRSLGDEFVTHLLEVGIRVSTFCFESLIKKYAKFFMQVVGISEHFDAHFGYDRSTRKF